MRRGTIVLVLGGLATLAVIAAALVGSRVIGGTEPDSGPLPRPDDGIVAVPWVNPTEHAFGDRVAVRLDVLVDERVVDPDDIQIDVKFAPFQRVGDVLATRRSDGATTLLRYEYGIACVADACLAPGTARTVRLPEILMKYTRLDRPLGAPELRVNWPELVVRSRLSTADLADPQVRYDPRPSVPSTFRIAPPTLGWLAASLAGLLLLLLGGLWARATLRRPIAVVELVEATPEDVLEAATRRLVSAAAEGIEERRASLDALARALASVGRLELVDRARRLAWSRAEPARPEIEALVLDVRNGATGRSSVLEETR